MLFHSLTSVTEFSVPIYFCLIFVKHYNTRGEHKCDTTCLKFLPMNLAALPKTFGLIELKKGWFAHHFNRKQNQDCVGNYPTRESYGYNFKGTEECLELIWNGTSVKGQQFDFKKEMKEYCVSKVESLTFFDKLVSNSDSFL